MLAVKGGGGGNRNAKGLPVGPDGQRPWSHGLCTCTEDCGLFCRACCDPCVIYGRNKQRYEHLHLYGVPDPQNGKGEKGDDACQRHAWITCFFGSGWLFQIPLRGKLRKRYGIRGSCMGDCCSSSFCQPCALAQESRELALEEESLRAKGVV
ncbi:PLAC8 family-domain-containing protein [Schizophyllum commune]